MDLPGAPKRLGSRPSCAMRRKLANNGSEPHYVLRDCCAKAQSHVADKTWCARTR